MRQNLLLILRRVESQCRNYERLRFFVCRSKPKRGEKMKMKRNVLKVFISLILSLSLLLTTAMVSSFGANGLETKSENTVYLTDLAAESSSQLDFTSGATFGTQKADGKDYPNSIAMTPGADNPAFIHYDLTDMGFKTLSFAVAKASDNTGNGVIYKVIVDGREAYNSGALNKIAPVEQTVNIDGASDICLKIESNGDNAGDLAYFLSPSLEKDDSLTAVNYDKVSLLSLSGVESTNRLEKLFGDTDKTFALSGNAAQYRKNGSFNGFEFDTGVCFNEVSGERYVQYDISNLKASKFSAYVGLDSKKSTASAGNTKFALTIDKGQGFDKGEIIETPLMKVGEYYRIYCDISDAKSIRIVNSDGGDGSTGEAAVFADPAVYIKAPENEQSVLYVSDMALSDYTNKGDVIKDKSGMKNLVVGGKAYKKGLLVNPTTYDEYGTPRPIPSQLHYSLTGVTAGRFKATVGLCLYGAAAGNGVVFTVYGDGVELYKSAVIKDEKTVEEIDVSIKGYKSLSLRVTPENGSDGCQSVFADARLTFEGEISENHGKTAFVDTVSLTTLPTYYLDASEGYNTTPDAKDLLCAGRQFGKGIASHPNGTSSAVAKYDLTGLGYTRFSAYVGKRDRWIPLDSPYPYYVQFMIYGDDVLLSSTDRIDFLQYFFTSVDITGVNILTIELNMSNDFYNCDSSGWFEPTLYRELDRGEAYVTSPQIYPDLVVPSYSIDMKGVARSVNPAVVLNSSVLSADSEIDPFGAFGFNFTVPAGENTLEIVSKELSAQKTVYSTKVLAQKGDIIKLNNFQLAEGSYSSSSYYRNQNHLGKILSVGSQKVLSHEGLCCLPNNASNMDANFDISDFDYTYFRATVGRDDFGNTENRVRFYVLADGRQIALSNEMAPGQSQLITATVPANASILTLRAVTTEGISGNAADWIEPILCRSESSLNKNEKSEFSASSATAINSKYNFGARFSAAQGFSQLSLHTSSSGEKEVALYKYTHSFNRSLQATPIYKNDKLAVSGGALKVVLDQVAQPGEYLLVVYDGISTRASKSDYGFVYTDGTYTGAFPEMSIVFESNSASCFNSIKDKTEPEENTDNTGSFTDEEKQRAKQKIEGYINDLSTLPVSMTLGGKTYEGLSAEHFARMKTETSEDKDYGKQNTTVYLVNKESRVNLTVEFSAYPDYAAYEWTIYYTNPSSYGDLDKNGKIEAVDALRALQTFVGTYNPEGEDIFVTDVNGDGEITTSDALIILQCSVGSNTMSRNGNTAKITNPVAAKASFEGANPYIGTSYSDINNANTAPYMPMELYLKSGDEYTFAPSTGRSTENVFPYYNIEHGSDGTFMAIGWSGTWQSDIAFDGSTTTVTAKQQTFDSYLKAGERVATPTVAFVEYSGRDLSRSANLWRKWIIDCNMRKDENGEIMKGGRGASVTGSEDTNKTGNQNTQIEQFNYLLDKGVDLNWWWIDAGWYPTSFNDDKTTSSWAAVGNWTVSSRYGDFSEVGKNAHDKGKKVLLWFEPERFALNVNDLKDDGTTLKKEWMTDYGTLGFDVAGQHMVNLGNDEAREWVTNRVISILKAANFDLYREDFNIIPAEYWKLGDTEDRQGITENLSVQGHYKFWDDLIEAGYFIDCCASGGNRNDLQSLRRAVFLHPTDALYSAWNAKQGGAMVMYRWMPYFGANTSGAAGTGAEGKYNLRSSFRPWTEFIYNVPTENGSVDWNQIAGLSKEVAGLQNFIYDQYYELTEWSIGVTDWLSYEFFNSEQNKGYAIVYARERTDVGTKTIRFKGLLPDKNYTVTSTDTNLKVTATGRELMLGEVELTLSARSSDILYINAA